MYSLTIRGTIMVAHSLSGEIFGPAQRLHGATFVIEVTMLRPDLDDNGIVADIDRAQTALQAVLAPLDLRNLDELPEFAGRNTTTEAMAAEVHARFAARVAAGALGGDAAAALSALKVTVRETPDAWATYEAPLDG